MFVEGPINHLLFVNDSLIFYKINREASNNLSRILNVYAQTSGQCINKEKTTMVFSKNVGKMDKTKILAMQGCRDTKQYNKYLGLPPMIGP